MLGVLLLLDSTSTTSSSRSHLLLSAKLQHKNHWLMFFIKRNKTSHCSCPKTYKNHWLMKLQAQLLLFASVAAALLLLSRGVVAGGLTDADAMPMHALRDVEDDVSFVERDEEVAAYPRRRVLYSSQYISYNGLGASQAACYGSCPGRGQPYNGRGCKSVYQCG